MVCTVCHAIGEARRGDILIKNDFIDSLHDHAVYFGF